MDTPQVIASRLIALRQALGFKQAKVFSEFIGAGETTWNTFERAHRAITIETATKLTRKTGASLDWIYLGFEHTLPFQLAEKLRLHADLAKNGDRDWLDLTAAKKRS